MASSSKCLSVSVQQGGEVGPVDGKKREGGSGCDGRKESTVGGETCRSTPRTCEDPLGGCSLEVDNALFLFASFAEDFFQESPFSCGRAVGPDGPCGLLSETVVTSALLARPAVSNHLRAAMAVVDEAYQGEESSATENGKLSKGEVMDILSIVENFMETRAGTKLMSLTFVSIVKSSGILLTLQVCFLWQIIREWNSELQERTGKFRKQATAVAEWDRRILQNRDVLIRLEAEVAKVVETQTSLERQLELIETHQLEVDKALQSMEVEAERIYKDESGLLLADEAASVRDSMSVSQLFELFKGFFHTQSWDSYVLFTFYQSSL
ncbi:hypothetical protein Taro_032034 [Colocasia esculenta]|uniref:Nucleoporin NSP1-like C-terminal domain-containing protein n=1 Tax=Colocasia esculenta TaxID=4460 RepID=A0A843VTN3_COLES|nr:hypothetical protein [Colocasia esculenta]